ncbi:MAG TPA: methyltransferase domain-containing protein [Bryobacteraceae bacterium]|nr:methyltransferase domain-containing protein [Bryobacteraceae bacterium]
MLEFTGERVVPGLVDPNLFNEHLARYRFAAHFAGGLARSPKILDAGCGSGYGTAEFPGTGAVVAMDVSAEAVAHARRTFHRPGADFLQGACESLPFGDGSFDLVVAFEVIEHLEHWPRLLAEARRVLGKSGTLLVSTPNKAWYGESRAEAGANPWHIHEFEYREFEAALREVFPHVQLWSQNHSETITFVPAQQSIGDFDAPAGLKPEQSHFFLAACSASPIARTGAFAWLASSGNILRERQRHIALLEAELEQNHRWLAESHASHAQLQKSHEAVIAELQTSNLWASQLNTQLAQAGERIASLQDEIKTTHAGYQEHIARLESEAAVRLEWVGDLEAQIARARVEIARLNEVNQTQERTIEERTLWAQSLERDLNQARAELEAIGRTGLVRLGRRLNLVPAGNAEKGSAERGE